MPKEKIILLVYLLVSVLLNCNANALPLYSEFLSSSGPTEILIKESSDIFDEIPDYSGYLPGGDSTSVEFRGGQYVYTYRFLHYIISDVGCSSFTAFLSDFGAVSLPIHSLYDNLLLIIPSIEFKNVLFLFDNNNSFDDEDLRMLLLSGNSARIELFDVVSEPTEKNLYAAAYFPTQVVVNQ